MSVLEQELQYTKENLQNTIEELEAANEELKSMNEELQSTNEEMQSTNEELETAKEEMQSLNEELQTVNAELQSKVDELSHTNDDMMNLLNGTDIATVFLDNQLLIKRFTVKIQQVINLIQSDIGRPIGDIVTKLHYGNLLDDAQEVLRTLIPKEHEVQAESGHWYLIRLLPYRTANNVIDGLVITFVNTTSRRQIEEELRERDHLLRSIVDGTTGAVFVKDLQGCYLLMNAAGLRLYGKTTNAVLGYDDTALFAADEARAIMEDDRQVMTSGASHVVEDTFILQGERVTLSVSKVPYNNHQGVTIGLIGIARQVSKRPQAARQRGASSTRRPRRS